MSCVEYAEKLSLQCERKKERKTKSSSSSFSSFSPSMPVPLEQMSFVDLEIITISASLAAVCAVTLAVTGPSVTTALTMSTPGLLVPELPWKRLCVTDPKE